MKEPICISHHRSTNRLPRYPSSIQIIPWNILSGEASILVMLQPCHSDCAMYSVMKVFRTGMHLLVVYGGNFRICTIFSGLFFKDHFHHCVLDFGVFVPHFALQWNDHAMVQYLLLVSLLIFAWETFQNM